MIKILTLGAAGVLGSEITRQLESLPDVEQVCRAAVAKLITRIVTEPTPIYRNESIGITN